MVVRKLSAKENLLVCEKDKLFQLMQINPIKTNFFSAHRGNNFPPYQS